jgi:hypothetical protein
MKQSKLISHSSPLPISIPEDIAARCDGPDQFEKFDNLFRTVIATPKAEIDKNEAKWKRAQAKRSLSRKSR